MKKTLHTELHYFLHYFLKSTFLIFVILLVGSSSFAQSDIQVNATNLKLVNTFKINQRGTRGPLSADPNALYSNVTTYSELNYFGGGSTMDIDGNTITKLVADSLALIGDLPFSIGQFSFAIANDNVVTVSARPRLRFYANDGVNGGPGTFITGYSFDAITYDANSTAVYTGTVPPFTITTRGFWAGITFDDNKGTTGITAAQLDKLGMGIFDPIDVGSSTDGFFQTDVAGSFLVNDPAGATYIFPDPPPTNFGWEFVSSIPLPVTLTDFQVQRSGITNTVSWKTSQELNSSYFLIQRSNDGSNFTEIGRVKAAGKSATIKNYSFADAAPKKGINYYRIKMVDLDNSGRFSDIKNIRNEGLLIFSLYPNPVKGNLVLEWNSESAGKAVVIITDLSGHIIYNKESEIITGNNKVVVDVSKFAKGIYNLKVKSGDDKYSQTFNKL
ncbi:MAG: T9SS type A sorting domain-containing protein [Ginsengibacter sp.]